MSIIDFSSHIVPPTLNGVIVFNDQRESSEYDIDTRIKIMDKYNIQKQVVSLSAAWLYGLTPQKALYACELANDYIAKMVSTNPNRFVGCGVLDLRNIESALTQTEKIVKKLGFKCLTVGTHQGERSLDDEYFYPFYEFINEENIPLFIHPISFDGYELVDEKNGQGAMQVFGWPFETSWAIWKMIVNRVFDKFNKLKIVTHHLGGMLPHLFNRANYRFERNHKINGLKHYKYYFKNIYADTALDGTSIMALLEGYELFGPNNIVFGSDWPFIEDSVSYGNNINAINSLPIPDEEKLKILYSNAVQLLNL